MLTFSIGCTLSHVIAVFSSTYEGDDANQEKSVRSDVSQFPLPDPTCEPLFSTVWDWLRARKDVSIGEARSYNNLSLHDVLSMPEEPQASEQPSEGIKSEIHGELTKASASATVASHNDDKSKSKKGSRPGCRPRIFASQDRMWTSIAGHSADFKRIPRLEWAALVGIASTRHDGILQGDLCRLVGQDKRSLPRRTDSLAQKGYIIKRTTLAKGLKTSKMWLLRLAPSLPAQPKPEEDAEKNKAASSGYNLAPEALNLDMNPVPWRSRWTGKAIDTYSLAETTIAIVKAFNIIRYHDLRRKLGILGLRWQMKTTARVCRWMVRRGIIQYVGATLGDRLFKDCLKFIRDFNESDWGDYLRVGKEKSRPKPENEKTLDAYRDKPTDDAEAGPDTQKKPSQPKRITLQATWKPEKPLTTSIMDAIRSANAKGATHRYIGNHTLGPPFTRYATSITSTMATASLQPPHLKHFQVASEIHKVKKAKVYVFTLPSIDSTGVSAMDTGPPAGSSQPPPIKTDHHGNAPVKMDGHFSTPAQGELHKHSASLELLSKLPERRPRFPSSRRIEQPFWPSHGTSDPSKAHQATIELEDATKTVEESTTAVPAGDAFDASRGHVTTMQDTLRPSPRRGRPPSNLRTLIVTLKVVPASLFRILNSSSSLELGEGNPGAEELGREDAGGVKDVTLTNGRHTASTRRQFEALNTPDTGEAEGSILLAADEQHRLPTVEQQQTDGVGLELEQETPDIATSTAKSNTGQKLSPDPIIPTKRGRAPKQGGGKSSKQSKGSAKKGEHRCTKCGGVWKNDNGLQYHLEKSSSACNLSYVPPPPKPPKRRRATTPMGIDESQMVLSNEGKRSTRGATTSTTRAGMTSPKTPILSRRAALVCKAPSLITRSARQNDVATDNTSTRSKAVKISTGSPSANARPHVSQDTQLSPSQVKAGSYSGGLIDATTTSFRDACFEPTQVQEDKNLEDAPLPEPKVNEKLPDVQTDQPKLEPHPDDKDRNSTGPETADSAREDLLIDPDLYLPYGTAPRRNHEPHEPAENETVSGKRETPQESNVEDTSYLGELPPTSESRLSEEPPPSRSVQDDASTGAELSLAYNFKMPHESETPDTFGYRYGAQAHRVAEVILFLLNANGGAFPGGRSLWYGLCSVWEKAFATDSLPSHGTCQFVLAKLVEKHRAAKSTHAFRDQKGIFKCCTVIRTPSLEPSCPAVLRLKDHMIEEHPRPYVDAKFMPSTGMPDESTWNGQPVFSKRRKLAKELEVLDAPFYARRIPMKRRPIPAQSETDEVSPRKKRRSTGSNAVPVSRKVQEENKTGFNVFRSIVGGHDHIAALQQRRTASFSTPNVSASIPALTFLEPNTHLDEDEKLVGALIPDHPELDEDGGQGLRTGSDVPSTRIPDPFVGTEVVTDRGGNGWPTLPNSFFERERSFAMHGKMPSIVLQRSQRLPPSWAAGSTGSQNPKGSGQHHDSDYSTFMREIRACSRWELDVETRTLILPESIGPAYTWINHQMRTPIKSGKQTLVWHSGNQLTRQSYRRKSVRFSQNERERPGPEEELQSTKRQRRFAHGSRPPQNFEHQILQARLRTRTLTPWNLATDEKESSSAVRQLDDTNDSILIAAFVATRTLLGGADKYVDWGLMTKLLPNKTLPYLRRFWSKARKDRAASITQLTERFQKQFIAAYQQGAFPVIDYDNYLEYDWTTLIQWTASLNDDMTVLPRTKEDLEENYSLEPALADTRNWQDDYYGIQSSANNRLEALTSKAAVVVLDQSRDTHKQEEPALTKAKSWMRALCGTDPEQYESKEARAKVASVSDRGEAHSNALLQRALASLQSQNVITKTKHRHRDPRSHRLSEWFLPRFTKASHERKFMEAATFKARLDAIFRRSETLRIPYVVPDGEVMAIINLQAHGKIDVSSVDVPHVPLGFKPGFYESRKLPKSFYNFGLEITPTSAYIYDGDLGLLERTEKELPVKEGPEGALPLWVDFFGKLDITRWGQALGAVVFAIVTRGPLDVEGVCTTLNPYLEAFEVQLVIEWALRNCVLKRTSDGGFFSTEEWWWLVVGRQRALGTWES